MNEQGCTILVRHRAVSYDPSLRWDTELLPCEHCGKWARLERHHRVFRSQGGGWTPSGIILLCPPCHLLTTDEKLAGTGLNVRHEDPSDVPVFLWYVDGFALLDDAGGFTPC